MAVYGFANLSINEDGKIIRSMVWLYQICAEKFRKWQKNTKFTYNCSPDNNLGEGNRSNVFNLLNQIAAGRCNDWQRTIESQ